MAVHKSNPTIVFVKEFIVKKDNRIEDLTIDMVDKLIMLRVDNYIKLD